MLFPKCSLIVFFSFINISWNSATCCGVFFSPPFFFQLGFKKTDLFGHVSVWCNIILYIYLFIFSTTISLCNCLSIYIHLSSLSPLSLPSFLSPLLSPSFLLSSLLTSLSPLSLLDQGSSTFLEFQDSRIFLEELETIELSQLEDKVGLLLLWLLLLLLLLSLLVVVVVVVVVVVYFSLFQISPYFLSQLILSLGTRSS